MLVSTSPLSQGEQKWTRHHCATDGRWRYRSQGYAVAASTAAMVICLLTVSKAQGGPEAPGRHSLGHLRVFPPQEAERKEWK